MTGPIHILDDELGEWFPDVPDVETLRGMGEEEVARLVVIAASAVSEECYCEEWGPDAEEVVYRASFGAGPIQHGLGTITPDECAALARLREALGGRWVARNGDDFYVVPAPSVGRVAA